ncbi:tyrosine-type recombinase/integrase [Streptomyces sp. AF1A]|uniref:tyrosine-type recombinase/integrase n=1 Tax=Streptomyces sp. AF1A TaxID=3394350 RepID=UPI0039BC265D
MEPRNFTREFNRRCERAKVRQIRVHDTRHTCASLLAALDVHPRIAMQILRHSEIAVTMEAYAHVPSSETRRALRKLGKALGGSKQKDAKKRGRRQQEDPSDMDGRQDS